MKKFSNLMCAIALGFITVTPCFAGFKEHFDLG